MFDSILTMIKLWLDSAGYDLIMIQLSFEYTNYDLMVDASYQTTILDSGTMSNHCQNIMQAIAISLHVNEIMQ